tara:strand:- start:29399 stop:30784 length:1386 start_codon:yes stop_codon:yes gene_type:complete
VFLRLIIMLLGIELIISGYLIVQRGARPAPVLPPEKLMNPLFANDILALTQQVTEDNSAFGWIQLGEALLGQGFYSHAELCFGQAARLLPASNLAQARLAFCLERTGRTQRSTEIYEKLCADLDNTVESKRKRMQYRYEIGRNYLREENIKQAEMEFRNNLGFLPARYQLAKLLLRTDRSAEALPLITASLQQIPRSLKFLELQLRALRQQGALEDAEKAAMLLEQAHHSIPLHPGTNIIEPYRLQYGIDRRVDEFNTQIGDSSLELLAEEIKTLLELLGEQPSTHRQIFLMRLLEVEFQQKKTKQMRETIQLLDHLGINNAEILLYKAEAIGMEGDWKQAASLGERAALTSKTPQLHFRVAEILEKSGDSTEAKLQQAIAFRLEAMQFYRNNDLTAASKAIQQSLDLNPDDAQTWFNRGLIRQAAGKTADATSDFQECIKLTPQHGRARQKLSQGLDRNR